MVRLITIASVIGLILLAVFIIPKLAEEKEPVTIVWEYKTVDGVWHTYQDSLMFATFELPEGAVAVRGRITVINTGNVNIDLNVDEAKLIGNY